MSQKRGEPKKFKPKGYGFLVLAVCVGAVVIVLHLGARLLGFRDPDEEQPER